MKVLIGHLTIGNRKAIKAILGAGLKEGKVGNTNYHLSIESGVYSVKITKTDRGLGFIGNPLRVSTYTSTFKIN